MSRDKTGVEVCDNNSLAPRAHATGDRCAIPNFVGTDEKWTAKSVQGIEALAFHFRYTWHHAHDLRFRGGQPRGDPTVRHREVMGHDRLAAARAGYCLKMGNLLRFHLIEGRARLRRIRPEAFVGLTHNPMHHSGLNELDHLHETSVVVR